MRYISHFSILSLTLSMMACAPFSSMPPPEHYSAGMKTEVGAVGGYGFEVDLDNVSVTDKEGFGQGYLYYRLNDKHLVGLKVQYMPQILNGGAFYRYALKNDSKLYRGLEIEAGAMYMKAAYLMAWRQENGQFYISPALMLHPAYDTNDIINPGLMLPIGYSLWIRDRISINLEVGGGTYTNPTSSGFGSASYVAMGISSRY